MQRIKNIALKNTKFTFHVLKKKKNCQEILSQVRSFSEAFFATRRNDPLSSGLEGIMRI